MKSTPLCSFVILFGLGLVSGGCSRSADSASHTTTAAGPTAVELERPHADPKNAPDAQSISERGEYGPDAANAAKELADWKERLKPLPDDILAIYYEASRIHVEKGTDGYYTIEGVVKQLESPPPEAVMDYIKERLKNFKPGRKPDIEVWSGRGKKEGSTAVNTGEVWRQAMSMIKWWN